MATTAAQMAAYIYPEEEDPEGAFSWWLSPCGGTELVPEEIKRIFDILSAVSGGVSSFKEPKNISRGSGKKGDDGNPNDRSAPRPGSGVTPGSGGKKKKKCYIPPSRATVRVRGTLRRQSCVADETQKDELVITSVHYAANAAPTQIAMECSKRWSQACFHYSSAISVHRHWATLTCPPEAATSSRSRTQGPVVDAWSSQHRGAGWTDKNHRTHDPCERDEYPPAYLLTPEDFAFAFSGINDEGQAMRYLPGMQNGGAAHMWKGVCFMPPLQALSDQEFADKVNNAPAAVTKVVRHNNVVQTHAAITVDQHPEFTISKWGHSGNPPVDDGMRANPCWPSRIAPDDPGFALMTYDQYYTSTVPYNYQAPYVPGQNGA